MTKIGGNKSCFCCGHNNRTRKMAGKSTAELREGEGGGESADFNDKLSVAGE